MLLFALVLTVYFCSCQQLTVQADMVFSHQRNQPGRVVVVDPVYQRQCDIYGTLPQSSPACELATQNLSHDLSRGWIDLQKIGR